MQLHVEVISVGDKRGLSVAEADNLRLLCSLGHLIFGHQKLKKPGCVGIKRRVHKTTLGIDLAHLSNTPNMFLLL